MPKDCVPGGIRTHTNGFGGRHAIHCATGTNRFILPEKAGSSLYSTVFSTTIVKLAASAARAPTAAHTGSSSVPITPTVMGISI